MPPLAVDLALPLRDPVAIFALALLVLLAAPLLSRLRVPSSVVLLVAGIALGPNALGVLDRDATIVLLGTVGLLYIMFLAGLEIDLHEFRRHRTRSLGFGLATYGIPQVVGTAVGLLVVRQSLPAAILFGSVFASHTLLAYPVVQRLGLQKENSVTAAVGATILTDTLALLVLAVVASGARAGGGADPLVVLRLVASLGAFAALVLWGLPRLGAWTLRTLAVEPISEFVFVLAAVFACAFAVELLGVEAIIGAFLAGLALNRLVPEDGPLMNRISFFGNALFIPFFLLSTGMLVDFEVFAAGPRAGLVAAVMVVTILATKGAAAWVTRPAFGYSADEVRLVFGLTVPQAAATLAAVLVGFEVGLFDAAVLNGTIAMVFVTCVVGPWIAERAGAALAATARARRPERGSAPARLLVSLANPQTAEAVVDVALLARDEAGSVQAVTVVSGAGDRAAHVVAGEQVLARAVAHAAGAAVSLPAHVRVQDNVPRALARAVSELRASALVMGWDGSAAATRLLFGSLPDRILAETPAAVVVARTPRPLAAATRVVLAVPPLAEQEPGFGEATALVVRLAARVGAPVAVCTPAPYQAAVARALAQVPGARSVETLPLDAWGDLLPALADAVRPGDAVALVSARQGALSWRASLDRLPRALGLRLPEASLLVLYPAQVPASALLPEGLTSGERAFFDRLATDHLTLDLPAVPPPDLYRAMLQALPREAREAAVDALGRVGPDVTPDVRPGVVLRHAATDAVPAPALFVGIRRDGVAFPGASAPARVVLVLLVPSHLPDRRTVAWLASLARIVRDDSTLDVLAGAETPEAARSILLSAYHGARPPDPESDT